MIVQEKGFARIQHVCALMVGLVMIVLLVVAEIALVALVLEDSVDVKLDGKVLHVIRKRHVLLLMTVRRRFMEYVKQQMCVNAM
jgi:hypothetical protein